MVSALYSIYALVVFVSEISLVRCAHSFDFWYVNNSCVNTVRPHFPWSILYIQRAPWRQRLYELWLPGLFFFVLVINNSDKDDGNLGLKNLWKIFRKEDKKRLP